MNAAPRSRAWISDRLRELGLKKKDLADAWGVHSARVTEVLKGTREVQQREIDITARVLQTPRGEIMERLGYQAKQGPYIDIEDFRVVEIQGTVQAGLWQDAAHRPDPELAPVMIPRISGVRSLFGLVVRGNSMNRMFRDGDIVICQPIEEYEGDFCSELLVVVERRMHDQVEATVKELEIRGREYWLWPRSDEPEFQAPIRVPPPEEWDGNEEHDIKVTAVVLRSIQNRLPGR